MVGKKKARKLIVNGLTDLPTTNLDGLKEHRAADRAFSRLPSLERDGWITRFSLNWKLLDERLKRMEAEDRRRGR